MLRLVCQDGEKVSIAKSFLGDLTFFQSRPEVIASGTYHLRCGASHGVVDDLVAKIYDSSARVTITPNNVGQFRELCSELGFHGLDENLRAFEVARAQVGVDEKLESIEQSVTHHETELLNMHEEIQRLQALLADHADMLSKMKACEKKVDASKASEELHSEMEQRIKSLEQKVDASLRSQMEKLSQKQGQYATALEALDRKVKEMAAKLETLKGNCVTAGSGSLSGVFPCLEEWPLDGIIAHLTRECGGNVHDKGIIEVTASSVIDSKYPAKNVADLSSYNWFISGDAPNSWVCYDFKGFRVYLKAVSVRSFGDGPGAAHPRYLYLEGYDGKEWKYITSVSDLNDKYVTRAKQFGKCGPFRSVRLVQKDTNSRENNILALSAFEVFGRLVDCRKKLTVRPAEALTEEASQVTTERDGQKVVTFLYVPWKPVTGILAYRGASVSYSSWNREDNTNWDRCSECKRRGLWADKLCSSCSQKKQWAEEARRERENFGRGGGFCSKSGGQSQWIIYQFSSSVVITGYYVSHPSSPAAWVLSVSHDGTLWQDLDLWKDVKSGHHQLSRPTEPVRCIRLLQSGQGRIEFSRIEFFGSVL